MIGNYLLLIIGGVVSLLAIIFVKKLPTIQGRVCRGWRARIVILLSIMPIFGTAVTTRMYVAYETLRLMAQPTPPSERQLAAVETAGGIIAILVFSASIIVAIVAAYLLSEPTWPEEQEKEERDREFFLDQIRARELEKIKSVENHDLNRLPDERIRPERK